jgi:hypothetical protein
MIVGNPYHDAAGARRAEYESYTKSAQDTEESALA